MKVLLTGASSFSGVWFAEKLAAAGAEVVAPLRADLESYTGVRGSRVSRLSGFAEILPGCSFGGERFMGLVASRRFDVFCHHAAHVADYRDPAFDVVSALTQNTRGLPTVLERMRGLGLSAVVATGSVFEQDEGVGTVPLRAFSPYGLSKGLTWQVVRHWCTALGVPLAKFVIANPFGPFEEPRFCAYLVNTWRRGEIAEIRTPRYVRDNIHVDLLALAYARFVSDTVNTGVGRHFGPCGYIETQGSFARRVAAELGPRLGLDGRVRSLEQTDVSEPLARINTDVIDPTAYGWDEAAAWDAMAAYYRTALRRSIKPISATVCNGADLDMRIIGAVDELDFQRISGWLTSGGSPTIRFAQVFVDGSEVGTVKADSFRADLKEKKISDGHSGFRFYFSRTPDIYKDHKIEVRDRDTGEPIGRKDITLSSYMSAMADAPSMLEFDRNLRAVNIIDVSYESDKCHLTLQIVCPGEITPAVTTDEGRLEGSRLERQPDAFFELLGLNCYIMKVDLVPDGNPGNAIVRIISTSTSPAMMDNLSVVAVPKQMPNYSSFLSEENMSRVVGPGSTKGRFAADGLNTAYRLHLLLQHHFHNGLHSFKNILDWGVGAGRVALPIKCSIAPDSRVVGVDVDDYNVEFGKTNFPEVEFVNSPFLPPLPFEDGSFDLVFGVSVFTHLSEGVQFLWLKELRRIVKRGAPVIVSIHGERAIFHTAQWNPVLLMETSKFGISDSMIDTNLGPKLSDHRYYRATFHARKYIAARWVEYFDLVGHHPCTNGMIQDFIVLRAK